MLAQMCGKEDTNSLPMATNWSNTVQLSVEMPQKVKNRSNMMQLYYSQAYIQRTPCPTVEIPVCPCLLMLIRAIKWKESGGLSINKWVIKLWCI